MKFLTNSLHISRLTFIFSLLMIFCAGGFFGSIFRFENPSGILSKSNSGIDYPLYNEARSLLGKYSIEYPSLSLNQIDEGLVKGLIGSLQDKHSEYFSPEEKKDFHESLDGNFEGIGATVETHPLGVQIQQIIAGSPALEGGLQVNDIIASVNGEDLEGLTSQQAVKKIRGPAGTEAQLKIYRESEKNILEKKIIRKKIDIPSVLAKKEDDIGYIAINLFGTQTAFEFAREYSSLRNQGIRGLVIDLRNNGGGFLETAQFILSEFIEKNAILVTTKSSKEDDNMTYVSLGQKWNNLPTVVLINESSASASEITAGALQDYKKAIIVGKKSYGKGSVQQAYSLGNGGEIKITVAHWYTPKNRNIEKEKINPDIPVEFTPEDLQKNFDRQKDVAFQVIKKWISLGSYEKTLLNYKK